MNHQTLKILVRGTNWLGDAVMSIPALDKLRRAFPHAHITLVASPVSAGIFSNSRLIDDLFVYHRKERGTTEFLRLVRLLRSRNLDLAILFQNAFEAALISRLAGIPHRLGYRTQGRGMLLTVAVEKPVGRAAPHQMHDYLYLVDRAVQGFGSGGPGVGASRSGAEGPDEPMIQGPLLEAGSDQREAARRLLNDSGPALTVALNVGATNSRAKRWHERRFAELADRLAADFGARILLLGSPAESDLAARVAALTQCTSVINLAGATDLSALIGVLDRCHLIITNDTGSAHVAAALGRPTLTIFGPTNEFETAPLGPHAEIIRADGIDCARCMLRDCPIDHRCMLRITPDDIIERARPYLSPIRSERIS